MTTQLFQEIISHREATPQGDLPLSTEGTLRYVWESRFGDMLIEVIDGVTFVNGDAVTAAEETRDAPGQAHQLR